MKYQDQMLGDIDLTEPIILELIATPEMQRLKQIDQAGYPLPFFGWKHYSRFDHSLGVYWLLKRFGALLPEQIAGLIHDVNHTVFSHCVDYALSEGSEAEQSFQDNTFATFVKKSSLAGIIGHHGHDLDYILNEKNFPLLEREIPDLCADRLEYSLREITDNGTGIRGVIGPSNNQQELDRRRKKIDAILDSLEIVDNSWIFKDYAAGKSFAQIFSKINEELYSGFESIVMFKTVGDCLRYALEKKYLDRADLYLTDEQVLAKIRARLKDDAQLALLWQRMNNEIKAVNDPNNYEARVCCKSRVIDPWCWHKGKKQRVSQVDPVWGKTVAAKLKPKEYFLRFEE